MRVTKCQVGGIFEFNFEEVSISASECCDLEQHEIDAYFSDFISFFMDDIPVPNCEDEEGAPGGLLTVSNYYKQNCIKYCTYKEPLIYIDGKELIIIDYMVMLCGVDGGCCIETKKWCTDEGKPIPIDALTTTILGDCTQGEDHPHKCPDNFFVSNNQDCISHSCN